MNKKGIATMTSTKLQEFEVKLSSTVIPNPRFKNVTGKN